jgi:hypothetical protein
MAFRIASNAVGAISSIIHGHIERAKRGASDYYMRFLNHIRSNPTLAYLFTRAAKSDQERLVTEIDALGNEISDMRVDAENDKLPDLSRLKPRILALFQLYHGKILNTKIPSELPESTYKRFAIEALCGYPSFEIGDFDLSYLRKIKYELCFAPRHDLPASFAPESVNYIAGPKTVADVRYQAPAFGRPTVAAAGPSFGVFDHKVGAFTVRRPTDGYSIDYKKSVIFKPDNSFFVLDGNFSQNLSTKNVTDAKTGTRYTVNADGSLTRKMGGKHKKTRRLTRRIRRN